MRVLDMVKLRVSEAFLSIVVTHLSIYHHMAPLWARVPLLAVVLRL
jgi:hypothetical protein